MSRSRGSGRGGGRRRGRGNRGHFRRNPTFFLRELIGQTLAGVHVDLLKERGVEAVPEQEPVQLCLSFSEGGELAALCSSDGESIRVGRHPYSPLPDRERQYEVVREDQTSAPQWMAFVGQRCEDVVEVRDLSFGGKGSWVGIELAFEGGSLLTAYNWGDSLLTSAPPEETGFLDRTSLGEGQAQETPPAGEERKSRKRVSLPQGSGDDEEDREVEDEFDGSDEEE